MSPGTWNHRTLSTSNPGNIEPQEHWHNPGKCVRVLTDPCLSHILLAETTVVIDIVDPDNTTSQDCCINYYSEKWHLLVVKQFLLLLLHYVFKGKISKEIVVDNDL